MAKRLHDLNKPKKEVNKPALTLSIGHFSCDAYSAFINPIMPFIALKVGIALTMATTLISISHLCSSIIQPFFGFSSDILKKRFFIFWGMLISSVFLSLTGIVNSAAGLGICLALGSIGIAFYHPQATVFVKQFSNNESTKNMSLFLAAGTAGFSAGPLISSFVTEHFGLEKLPFLMIYGMIIAALILKFVPKTSEENSFEIFKQKISDTDFLKTFFSAIKESFSVKDFRILFAISVAKCMVVSSCTIFLPFLWQKLNYNVSKIGVLVFLFVLAGAIATITSSHVERKVGAKNVFYLSMVTILPLMLIFMFTYSTAPIISYITIILVGFFALLAIPINMVMAQNAIPKYKGLASGFIGGFSWGIVGLLLPVTGFLAEIIGIPTLLSIISIIPLICATFVKNLQKNA